MLNIVGHRNIYLALSAFLVGVAVIAIVAFGFQQGIDFTGGTLWEFNVGGMAPSVSDVRSSFAKLGLQDVAASFDASHQTFLVRTPAISEADHQKDVLALKGTYSGFEERSFQSIGPSIGAALKQKAYTALVLVLVGISLYIAFAFRKASKPVSSWKYGWITLLTLFHDVAIPAGLLAILGHFGRVEIDSNFIVALLVVMGFSVHDTIVVFDRIRENLAFQRAKHEFKTIINDSVNQSLARSINTSLTLILVLLALYFTGPAGLHYFVLTLLVGVTTGIYSSIFVASPALLFVTPHEHKK